MTFKCPLCGSRVYRGSDSRGQVYRCNDMGTATQCPVGYEPVGRTKAQVRRAATELNDGGVDQ